VKELIVFRSQRVRRSSKQEKAFSSHAVVGGADLHFVTAARHPLIPRDC